MPTTPYESLDRFELLSAYLDGEVSPQERALVEHWLTTDPEMQRLYRQLVYLHKQWQALPAPSSTLSADEVVAGVLTRLTQRARKRLVWSGMLVAASALVGGIVAGLVTRTPAPRLAQQPTPSVTTATLRNPQRALHLTLERPPVTIPAQLQKQLKDQ